MPTARAKRGEGTPYRLYDPATKPIIQVVRRW